MSDEKILSDKEIKKIWKNIVPVTSEDAKRIITRMENIPRPVIVNKRYSVLLSLNIYKSGYREYHLSISNCSNFDTAGIMAREILGECDNLDVGFRGVYHFVKDARDGV